MNRPISAQFFLKPSAIPARLKTWYNNGGRQCKCCYSAGNIGEHFETGRPEVTGERSREEVLGLIKEAIELHLEGLKEAGEPVPMPSSVSEYVNVDAA